MRKNTKNKIIFSALYIIFAIMGFSLGTSAPGNPCNFPTSSVFFIIIILTIIALATITTLIKRWMPNVNFWDLFFIAIIFWFIAAVFGNIGICGV